MRCFFSWNEVRDWKKKIAYTGSVSAQKQSYYKLELEKCRESITFYKKQKTITYYDKPKDAHPIPGRFTIVWTKNLSLDAQTSVSPVTLRWPWKRFQDQTRRRKGSSGDVVVTRMPRITRFLVPHSLHSASSPLLFANFLALRSVLGRGLRASILWLQMKRGPILTSAWPSTNWPTRQGTRTDSWVLTEHWIVKRLKIL